MRQHENKLMFDVGPKQSIRNTIMGIEDAISQQEGAFFGDTDRCPLKHSFADGIYVREIFIPKGMLITGKIHKHAHPNFLMSGTVDVITEGGGMERLVGPLSIISPAGTKRALVTITDVVWITVHTNPTNTEDTDVIERHVIAKDYAGYEKFRRFKENKIVRFITKLKDYVLCI
jgi:hypothetical protein